MTATEASAYRIEPCSLCGGLVKGHGHNPEPLARNSERCCDDCNASRVIPERLARATMGLPR